MRSKNSLMLDTAITDGAAVVLNTEFMVQCAFQVNAIVDSTAKGVAAGVLATLILQDITYTAKNVFGGFDSGSNAITIAYTGGGVAGSEVVTVNGFAISVQIQSGVSTATQVNAAIAASVAASVYVSSVVSGTGSNAQVTVAATNLTGGLDSNFNLTTNVISAASHGFFTGQVVQATKSGAAFPGGIAATTNYYVQRLSANLFSLYDTFAHALAASQTGYLPTGTGIIDITSDASAGSTITFTPTAISGASYKLQKSGNYSPDTGLGDWIDCVSGESPTQVTNTISASAVSYVSLINICSPYIRVLFAISAGSTSVKVYGSAKGF